MKWIKNKIDVLIRVSELIYCWMISVNRRWLSNKLRRFVVTLTFACNDHSLWFFMAQFGPRLNGCWFGWWPILSMLRSYQRVHYANLFLVRYRYKRDRVLDFVCHEECCIKLPNAKYDKFMSNWGGRSFFSDFMWLRPFIEIQNELVVPLIGSWLWLYTFTVHTISRLSQAYYISTTSNW